MEKSDNLVRREFLKVLAAAGVIPAVTSTLSAAPEPATQPATQAAKLEEGAVAPKRALGKTGAMIPCFAMGWAPSTEVLEHGLKYGFTHWDTATSYGTEPMIGKYLEANKGLRDKLFLSTKPPDIDGRLQAPDIAQTQKHLDNSLKNFKTDHIDLYLGVHAMPRPALLTDELHKFADDNKKAGKIKFFGFSNHANTADNLAAAARLDWIDAILVAYNYRMMMDTKNANNKKLNEAIDACAAAKIGLIAIKPLAWAAAPNGPEEKKLAAQFTEKGFDVAQVKLKLLLEDKRITSASVGMKKITDVDSCAGAALDKAKVAKAHRVELQQFVAATRQTYCTGCASLCGAALPGLPMISDVMRFMMYSDSYGQRGLARALFKQLPAEARAKLQSADYTASEAACPQRIAIGKVVREACEKLA